MNPLKFLPKIHKRDKVSDKISFYRGIVNDELTPLFKTKSELYQYITAEYKNKPFNNLLLQKVTLQNLIY